MRWDDVSLTRAEWRIPQTKAGRPHLLPLPNPLVACSETWRRVDGIPYVFPGQNGVGHLQNIKRAWDCIRLKAGIQDVRFYDLRRTVGSWLAGSGESLHLIGKVLNHSDVSTTAIYARLSLDPVRQALERNASRMLEAAAPQRAPAIMLKARKRSPQRAIQPPISWNPLRFCEPSLILAFDISLKLLGQRGLRALAPMPTIVRSDFVAIATQTHAAPTTRVVLGCVIKKEHARRVLTFLDQ
jgi:hypothetical protein